MNITDFFRRRPASELTTVNTPYGHFDLAKKADARRMKAVIAEVQRQAESLTRQEIDSWRSGWQQALDVENPSRLRLYNVYRDVEVDGHLSGAIGQINGFVKARSFKIMFGEKEDEEARRIFDRTWFKTLVDLYFSARYWGHTLIQLGDVVFTEGGMPAYDSVLLIPRRHVIPEYGRVVAEQGDDWRKGIEYRRPPFSDWLIECGGPYDLGLYLKAAPHTIPKKNMLAFWDTFGEVFGMPMRIAKTTSRDPSTLKKISHMMQNMGAKFWAVFEEGTDIDLKENQRTDAFNIYDRRVDRANSELSKILLYQTMTIDNGSSLSQSEVHLEVLKNLIEEIADGLRDMVNGQLIPRMVAHGFPLKGASFEWDYEEDYTPEQMTAIETMLLNNFDVDAGYFEEKYGVKINGRRTYAPVPDGPTDADEEKMMRTLTRFFGQAPRGGGDPFLSDF